MRFVADFARANLIASEILGKMADEWPDLAISHLRDFIDIDLPWWYEFINNRDRAYMKLKYAEDVSLEKSEQWLLNQVSPTLAAVSEVTKGEFLFEARAAKSATNRTVIPEQIAQ